MTNKSNSIHIVEPGGQGGVYQHILGAIQNGQFSGYRSIVVHTAKDAELTPNLPNVSYCTCMRYQRKGPRPVRAVISLTWVGLRMLPHLALTAAQSRSAWEIQGLFGKGIYAWLVGVPRILRRDVTFVPHNSFSRSGNWFEAITLTVATRVASRVVVFVNAERAKLSHAQEIEKRTLWQYVVNLDSRKVQHWEGQMKIFGNPVLLFIGQLRTDKNPRLLLEAANAITSPLTLVFAGQDKGAVGDINSFPLDPRHSRLVINEYLSMDDFQAIIEASNALVCPYSVASQSGVVSLAVQLGKRVIATDVGGLAEQTPYVFDGSTASAHQSLARILREILALD